MLALKTGQPVRAGQIVSLSLWQELMERASGKREDCWWFTKKKGSMGEILVKGSLIENDVKRHEEMTRNGRSSWRLCISSIFLFHFLNFISELLFPKNHPFRNTAPPQPLILSEFFQVSIHTWFPLFLSYSICHFRFPLIFSFQKSQYVSFLCPQFCTLFFTEIFTVPFAFSDTLTLHSSLVQLSFLYFFLSVVVYFGFPPTLLLKNFLS